jgi:hypothetical protein
MNNNFNIRPAINTELEEITELHLASFGPEEHIPVILGRRYIKAIYRWLIISKKTYILVATNENEIVGLVSVCDESYTLPMFIACLPEFTISLILHPSLIVNRKLWTRLLRRSTITKTGRNIVKQKGSAQLVIVAISSGYRGQGIFHDLIEAAKLISLKRGSTAIYSGIHKTNLSSRKAFIKEGWKKCPEMETSDTVYYVVYLNK